MMSGIFPTNLFEWFQIQFEAISSAGWTAWLLIFLIPFFMVGVVQSIRTNLRARSTIRRQIDAPKPHLEEVAKLARQQHREIPFIVILVPASNESAVISNTINRLAQIDYPTQHHAVVIITDEREKADDDARTTRDIADAWAEKENTGLTSPWLYVLEVPEWYSGRFGSKEKQFKKSTKGRALNYALQFLRDDPRLSQTDMLGILDADGRMHPEALREVAFKRLRDHAQVLQGPVFQISNYPNVTMSGRAAGIELSIYHLSTLAYRLNSKRKTAEFLAGTNYFIDLGTMIELDGWNEHALVEDAELGLRLFLEKQIKPGWLSCHEIEQTPPDAHVYLKQRQRWALGHFQLLPIIAKTRLPLNKKIALYWRVLSAILKSPFDIGLPVLGWLALFLGWTQGVPHWLGWIMITLFVGSIFVWDFFGRGYRMLSKYLPEEHENWRHSRIHQFYFIFLMPWLILLQAQPRLVALYHCLVGSGDGTWVKTKRSTEQPSAETAPLIHDQSRIRMPEFEQHKINQEIER